jgi:ArsR family transcriptional regulator, arsenate/arsenite/antimonite-responsive transcriptional repressor
VQAHMMHRPYISVKANIWYAVTMSSKAETAPLDRLFRALADPTRLRLVTLIAGREICVCFLVEILGMSQPKISRHLAYLRRAGLVAARSEGKWVHYRLVEPPDEAAADILRATLRRLRERPEMRRDQASLGAAACCAPGTPVQLQTAPRPVKVAIARA